IQDVKTYIDIDEEYIRTEVYGGYSFSSPDPDKQGTITLKETIVDLGYTDEYDIEKYYNTQIYQKALESLITESPDDPVYKALQEHFDQYE
ncbi:MAG: metal ABC transporter substrate-binding protein, partial [Clostridia bacterium]